MEHAGLAGDVWDYSVLKYLSYKTRGLNHYISMISLSRFLLMGGSLALFCMVLHVLWQCWRYLEGFTASFFVLNFYVVEGTVSFLTSFEGISNNSIYAFFSLCNYIFTFSCYYVPADSIAHSLWGIWFVPQKCCIQGLTQFRADVGELSVMWAAVWVSSLERSTRLTAFLTKYTPSAYFAPYCNLVRIGKISA